ncbi:MAG: hypothetical protein ACI88H_001153 [Cocleimonas sp.]|jgi:hypothetical protein
MARYEQNLKVYKKWLKQGRGQGRDAEYKPWLYVYNVPSSGRSHRQWSHTSNRVVHCMSDLELSTFLLLDWSESTTDIREQYPLEPKATHEIATKLGFRHPAVRGESIIMTSDFFVTMSNPNQPYLAIQVKPSSELEKPRVREKLAIEEAYWTDLNVPFQIITEQDLDLVKVENIKWLSPFVNFDIPPYELAEIEHFWTNIIRKNLGVRLIDLGNEIDMQLNQERGIALGELRLLFAKRKTSFDMERPFFDLLTNNIAFSGTNRNIGND